jgi:hypothetical protein
MPDLYSRSRNRRGFFGEPFMPTFMLIAGGADVDKRSGNNPKLAPVMLERYMTWIQGLRDSGRFMGSYKLHDQTGRRLTIRGGEVIDGRSSSRKTPSAASSLSTPPRSMTLQRLHDRVPAWICRTATWKSA